MSIQKSDWEFVPSASSLSSIHVVGDGSLQFVGFDKSLSISIKAPKDADLRLELDLERQLLHATEQYFETFENGNNTIIQLEAARVELLKLQLKRDLCRRVNYRLKNFILRGDDIFNHVDIHGNTRVAVLVMDIRKSTAMMLKSTEHDFAQYLNALMTTLVPAITGRFGIFEKFTGDGFIALYVESIVPDPVLRAVSTAFDCIDLFLSHRNHSDQAFNSLLSDYGISFGVDIGRVNINMISNEINVIGQPVVYASRMAGGKDGDITLNHQAKLELIRSCGDRIDLKKVRVKVKNEADHDGWKVLTDTRSFPEAEPTLV